MNVFTVAQISTLCSVECEIERSEEQKKKLLAQIKQANFEKVFTSLGSPVAMLT